MIKSFLDKYTEDLFHRKAVKKFPPSILKIAYRKLLIIDAAGKIDDLRMAETFLSGSLIKIFY